MPSRRLPGYDYTNPGAYFLTICTHRRAALFTEGSMCVALGRCWDEIPAHHPVDTDAFVVMPNHMHGILLLRAGHARPLQTVVGSFKSAAARVVNGLRRTPGAPVWQRGYYERVVRNERELDALREYIVANPAVWDADPENLARCRRIASAPWL